MPFDGTEVSPVARVLIDARGYLKRGWCTGSQGIDANGTPMPARHPTAVRWCLIGAIEIAAPNGIAVSAAMQAIGRFVPGGQFGLAHFNNTQRSVESVLGLIDRAIAEALNA